MQDFHNELATGALHHLLWLINVPAILNACGSNFQFGSITIAYFVSQSPYS